jgi:putative transposase
MRVTATGYSRVRTVRSAWSFEFTNPSRKREGKRSAYQAAPVVWYLNAQDPIHGVRPFEYVHIDHTPLDIFLIAGETRELLGRPWLSLAIDAESRGGRFLSLL